MALIASRNPTLFDLKNALGPDQMSVAAVIELLTLSNPILEHASMIPGNITNGLQFGVRRYLPKGTWRQLYQGVKPVKGGRAQVVVNASNLVAYAEIDADFPGDKAGLMADEVKAISEGMSQQIASAVFYGDNSADPAQFNGLAWHYNDKSAANGQNIIDAGGTGSDNRSIWIIGWGPEKITMFYPPAGTGNQVPTSYALGVSHENLGRTTTPVIGEKSDQGLMEVERDRLSSKLGLAVKDWRCAVRIANIDVSDLKRDHSSGAYLEDLLVRAMHRFGGSQMKGVPYVYMDRNLLSFLHRQRIADTKDTRMFNNTTGTRTPDAVFSLDVGGMPVYVVDALNVDEGRVT